MKVSIMKALHIIESETPGITRTRIIVNQTTTYCLDALLQKQMISHQWKEKNAIIKEKKY